MGLHVRVWVVLEITQPLRKPRESIGSRHRHQYFHERWQSELQVTSRSITSWPVNIA